MQVTFIGGYKMLKDKKLDLIDIVIGVVFSVFFLCLLITGEPLYLGDSGQYINQYVTREPIYPLIIQFLRWISEEYYYWLVIVFQNILAIIANTMFVCYLRRTFSCKTYVLPVIILVMLAPHIATPLASLTNFVLTNSLLTEGITFSLYLFYVKYLLEMIWSKELFGRNTWFAFGWAVLISLVRGQFMTLMIVWFLVGCCKVFYRKQWKYLVGLVLLMMLAFIGRSMFTRIYNYCEQGLFVGTASGKTTAFSNVLYVADRVDGEAIEDEELRNLYYDVYDAIYESEYNYAFAPSGLIERGLYHEQCHDRIKFDVFLEKAKAYVGESQGIYTDQYQLLMVEVDDIATQMQNELMPKVFIRYVCNYLSVISLGFVRSVAYLHPILNVYAVVIYLLAIALGIVLWRKKPDAKSVKFMAVVFLMLLGNVTATGLFIMCLSRYVLYNISLFYMAGLFMLIEFIPLIGFGKRK